MLVKVLALGAVAVVGFMAFGPEMSSAPVQGSFSGAKYVLEDGRRRFEYALDGATALGGVLIATGKQRGMAEGGAVASIHFFDNSGAAEFTRTQPLDHCSAAFFNAHARHRLLIPASAEVEERLRSLDFDDHENTASWRRFSLGGYCIRRADKIVIDGQPAQAPSNMFDNCMTMVVTSFSVQSEPLPQFTRRPRS